MKFKISDIKDGERMPVEMRYDAGRLEVEQNDIHYLEPVVLRGEVHREQATFLLSGQLSSRIEQNCARCLKPVQLPVRTSVELFYDSEADKTALGDEVDTTTDLRELLVLNYDPKCLCRPDCRGLCPACGVDLNERSCTCLHKQVNGFHTLEELTKHRQRS